MMAVMMKKLKKQKCESKRILTFNDYKGCLLNNKIILKSQQKFKRNAHNVCTENIALSSNSDKRLQTFERVTSYPYDVSVRKVCKTELLSKYKRLILMIIEMKIKQHNLRWPYIPDHPYRT